LVELPRFASLIGATRYGAFGIDRRQISKSPEVGWVSDVHTLVILFHGLIIVTGFRGTLHSAKLAAEFADAGFGVEQAPGEAPAVLQEILLNSWVLEGRTLGPAQVVPMPRT
jgi:hypothetical protein